MGDEAGDGAAQRRSHSAIISCAHCRSRVRGRGGRTGCAMGRRVAAGGVGLGLRGGIGGRGLLRRSAYDGVLGGS